VSKHRRGGTGRVSAEPSQDPADLPAARTSIVEVAVYGLLASAVAGAVLVLGGHPRWSVGAVVFGALVLVAVLLFASSKASWQPSSPAPPRLPGTTTELSTTSRHGRRRRH